MTGGPNGICVNGHNPERLETAALICNSALYIYYKLVYFVM